MECITDTRFYTYSTAIGNVTIVSSNGAITEIMLRDTIPAGINMSTALTDSAAQQLEEYFARKRRRFEIPIRPLGTPFQKAVWDKLIEIPYGETRSYKQVAEMLGNAKACRAVGMANNKNPIMIMIPCHRVIGSNGDLTGYAGGIEIKKQLLRLEGNIY